MPKVKVDVVVGNVPIKDVMATVKNTLYTGEGGDGKIFIYDVENVWGCFAFDIICGMVNI